MTDVAPVRFVPVIVTKVPTGPLSGLRLEMAGAGMTVKLAVLVAMPPGVVTPIIPVAAPTGTVAVICVDEITVNMTAGMPPNVTDEALLKFEPVMVTDDPIAPFAGLKPVIAGIGTTVKTPELTAVPAAAVTLMTLVVAPAGTTTEMDVPELTVNTLVDAAPNVTSETAVKFDPVIVTGVPTGPLDGLKPLTIGDGVPPKAVMVIAPVVAPAGTIAVTALLELTVNAAGVPLKLTAVAPVRFVPVIVTEVPIGPATGLKPLMAGAGNTVKLIEVTAVPPGVVTPMTPGVAPGGTVAVICVDETTANAAAAMPLKVTAVAPEKFVPVMVTDVPTGPPAGLKLLIVGTGITMTETVLTAVVPDASVAVT
jgi:hypothetical protein